jgi:hypothetical protein
MTGLILGGIYVRDVCLPRRYCRYTCPEGLISRSLYSPSVIAFVLLLQVGVAQGGIIFIHVGEEGHAEIAFGAVCGENQARLAGSSDQKTPPTGE